MDQASQTYRGEAGRRYHEEKRAVPPSAYPWVARARAQALSPHIRPTDTVFEFGVGYGWNLAALRCQRRLGHDIADAVALTVREKGIEFVADWSQLEDGCVDVVLCHHTLEHVLDPAETLRQLRRLLRNDGRLLLNVPWERERRYLRYRPEEPNHHLYTWNCQNLGNLVSAIGFSVTRVHAARYGYDRFAATAACRLRLGETGYRAVRFALHTLRPLWEIRLQADRGA